jgi:putative ABC transport system permease protein
MGDAVVTPLWRAALRLAIACWPRHVRRRLGAEVVVTAATLAADARARDGVLAESRLWARELADAVRTAWRLRQPRRTEAASAPWRTRLAQMIAADSVRSARQMRHCPLTSAAVVLTLAAVVAAAATTFGVSRAVLWRPLPMPDADRLLFLWEAPRADVGAFRVSRATYDAWTGAGAPLESMALFGAAAHTLEAGDGAAPLHGLRVSATYFQTLGVRPLAGRTFDAEDDRAGRQDVVVLSARAWRGRFGGRPTIVGETIRLSGAPFVVVGIMPDVVTPGWPSNPAHVGLDPDDRDFWTPMPPPSTNLTAHVYGVVARLAAGATADEVVARLSRAAPAGDGHPAAATRLREQYVRDARGSLIVLLVAVLVVLVAASANLAALQVVAFEAQRHELAVRTALGAGTLRLAVSLLVDIGLHAALGTAVGVALAGVALARAAAALPATVPLLTAPALDAPVLAVAAAVGVGMLGLTVAWPLLRLRGAARTVDAPTVVRSGAYRGLVVTQVALSVALAVPAVLLGRSFSTVRARDPGFVVDDVVIAQVSIPGPAPGSRPPIERVLGLERDLQAALGARPGVRGVAVAYDHPLESNWSDVLRIEGDRGASSDRERQAQLRIVSPSYFAALDVAVVEGRPFTDADAADTPGVALVNRALADELGRGALGLRVTSGGPRYAWGAAVPEVFAIVGIVENERFRGLDAATQPALYLSTRQFPQPTITVMVRSAAPATLAVRTDLPASIRAVGADASVSPPRLLTGVLDDQLAGRRLTTQVVEAFAAVTGGLALLGVYVLLAMSVTARRREMGVRMALGESPGAVARRVVVGGLAHVGAGLALGLGLALASGRLVAHLLVDVTAFDAPTLIGVTTVLAIAAVAASAGPAGRAARVDPAAVLKH